MRNDEFDEEIAAHLELETAQLMAEGHPEEEARRLAGKKFGNVTRLREWNYERAPFLWWAQLVQDIGYGLRQLRQQPSIPVAAVVALGLGIGANTAVFTVVSAVGLRPLPYAEPSELVWMTQILKKNSTDEVTITPDYLDWRERAKSFTHLAAYNPGQRIWTGADGAAQVQSPKTSHNLLAALGVTPMLGRAFRREEDIRGSDRVVILTHGMWLRAFGGAADAVGKTMVLDGEAHEIVGVMGPEFLFPGGGEAPDVMTPLGKRETEELKRTDNVSIVRNVIGRLRPGVDLATAQAEIAVIQKSLPEMPWKPEITIRVLPLGEHLLAEARRAGWLLLAATGVLLLIACANVANLLMAQGARRAPEMALRASLGATQGRLAAQLLAEAGVLVAMAAGMGLGLAYGMRGLLTAIVPPRFSGAQVLPMDARVVGFSIAVALVTIVLFGLGPVWRLARPDFAPALKTGGVTKVADPWTRRFLTAMASAQMALTLVLLTAAGYLLDQFVETRYRNVGFATDRGVVATVIPDWKRYATEPAKRQMQMDLAAALQRIPGAEGVGLTEAGFLPTTVSAHPTNTYGVEGREAKIDGKRPVALMQSVSADYLRVLGLRLRRGRWLTATDEKAVLINEGVERQTFAGEEPIGMRLRGGLEIVGVVEGGTPTIYFANQPMYQIGILLRTPLDVGMVAGSLRQQVARVDANQPVARIETLNDRLDAGVTRRRAVMTSLGVFALVALALAWVGVYGLLHFVLRWRMREMAIRRALGASPGQIRALLVKQILWLLTPALGVGVLLCVARSEPRLPWIAGGAAVVLIVSGLVAAWGPARKAGRVDAATLLRAD